MLNEISLSNLAVIDRKSALAAARLARELGVPRCDREDLQQDIIIDLLTRLNRFNPQRGEFGAFVHTVIRHGVARLAAKITQKRGLYAPVSLDDPVAGSDGGTLADIIPDPSSVAALASVEHRIDLGRARRLLRPDDIAVCTALIASTPSELVRGGLASRAGLYRRRREVQLCLTLLGIAA